MSIPSSTRFWGTHALDTGGPIRLSLGDVDIDVRSVDGDFWWRCLDQTDHPEASEKWTRWVSGKRLSAVSVTPSLPNRPVVVHPEVPFHIAPRSRAQIFVDLPLWASLETGGPTSTVIAELPLRGPSSTWWGDPTEGELAYRITTGAKRNFGEPEAPDETAVCRLELVNESEQALPVERIAVRAPQLAVFRGPSRFWTNEVRVTFTDEAGGSHVQVLESAPSEAGEVSRVSDPRESAPTGWRALTFARLVRGGMP